MSAGDERAAAALAAAAEAGEPDRQGIGSPRRGG